MLAANFMMRPVNEPPTHARAMVVKTDANWATAWPAWLLPLDKAGNNVDQSDP